MLIFFMDGTAINIGLSVILLPLKAVTLEEISGAVNTLFTAPPIKIIADITVGFSARIVRCRGRTVSGLANERAKI